MDYHSLLKLPCDESFPDNRLYLFAKTLVVNSTALHWHEFYELEFVTEGTATEIINGVAYSVGPGSCTLLSPVDFHCYQTIDTDTPFRIMKVNFQDLFLPKSLRNDIYMYSGAKIAMMNDPFFRALLMKLYEDYTVSDYAKDTFLMNGIVNLCILLMRRVFAENKENLLPSSEHSPIQEAVLYVRTHFRDTISAEAVAKSVHLSPNYFSEYFKKQTGEKFSIFVLRLRVEFAANLLRISDLSVKEIAFESGFNSAAYFSNTFKTFYHVSPEQYRRENRIANDSN